MEAVAMVMEIEEEDDVFFADLKRQISLLITEDVEDDHYYYYSYPSPSASLSSIHQIQQALSRQPQYQLLDHQHHHHHHHISTYKTSTTTDQQSKGTGVFIPKSSPQFTKRRSNKHQSKVTTTNTKQHVNYYYNKYKSSSYMQEMQVPSQGVFAQVRTSSQQLHVRQN